VRGAKRGDSSDRVGVVGDRRVRGLVALHANTSLRHTSIPLHADTSLPQGGARRMMARGRVLCIFEKQLLAVGKAHVDR